ncbi:hypothetical protein HK102_006075 [Quaeritorhiza haematococci]|nr:hypothetical protein HK102_006075 [Quaeritorhiza haematococci]
MVAEQASLVVQIVGVVLAAMQYDMLNAKNCGDFEGVLLGHVEKRIHSKVTDETDDYRREEYRICVTSYVPLGPASMRECAAAETTRLKQKGKQTVTSPEFGKRFYDAKGAVDFDYLRAVLGERFQLAPTLREVAIYRSLRSRPIISPSPSIPNAFGTSNPFNDDFAVSSKRSVLAKGNKNANMMEEEEDADFQYRQHLQVDFQVLGLFTATTTESLATMNVDYAFFHRTLEGGEVKKLPVVVPNLLQGSRDQYDLFVSALPPRSQAGRSASSLDQRMEDLSIRYLEASEKVFRETIESVKVAGEKLARSEAAVNEVGVSSTVSTIESTIFSNKRLSRPLPPRETAEPMEIVEPPTGILIDLSSD